MDHILADTSGLFGIALALFLGGILKGATGLGMPPLAIPVIAAFHDVRTAVVILVIPNFLVNLWQAIKYRQEDPAPDLSRWVSIWAIAGAVVGTWMLAFLPLAALNLALAAVIFGYIALRLSKPTFKLPLDRARRLAPVAGVSGGVLQGTLGISAPIAATFVNAMKLSRGGFIAMISVFFAAMCLAQLPAQLALGLMTLDLAVVGILGLIPLFAGLAVGDLIGKRLAPHIFDRVILLILAVLAIKQVVDVVI